MNPKLYSFKKYIYILQKHIKVLKIKLRLETKTELKVKLQ